MVVILRLSRLHRGIERQLMVPSDVAIFVLGCCRRVSGVSNTIPGDLEMHLLCCCNLGFVIMTRSRLNPSYQFRGAKNDGDNPTDTKPAVKLITEL